MFMYVSFDLPRNMKVSKHIYKIISRKLGIYSASLACLYPLIKYTY